MTSVELGSKQPQGNNNSYSVVCALMGKVLTCMNNL